MKFKAFIDSVHFDPKKGAAKIMLVGASHVSLDELTTLSIEGGTIQVTLESEQTKIGVRPNYGTIELEQSGGLQIIDKEAAVKLKEAADRLKEGDTDGDQ